MLSVTSFAPEGTEVGWCIAAGLDTVDLPALNPTSTQSCLISTPAILLAQQYVHLALCPLSALPAVSVEAGVHKEK